MCGIVGFLGTTPAAPVLLRGLERLEYRGYDSAGIATLDHGRTALRRAEGKVKALRGVIAAMPTDGRIGVAHTRWATHGAPRVENAHPHHTMGVSVVHNGIIENHAALRLRLQGQGCVFFSETDTEVVSHLVAQALKMTDSPLIALRSALAHLEGAYALGVVMETAPDRLFFARRGSPLVVGQGSDGIHLASDASAIADAVDGLIYLEDGDHGFATAAGIEVFDRSGQRVQRAMQKAHATVQVPSRGAFKHHMRKEMAEQPAVLLATRDAALAGDRVHLSGLSVDALRQAQRLLILGCGSSYHAALVGKNLIEATARMPVDVELASEWRYRHVALQPGTLVLGVSQSGETADTLAALEEAHRQGAPIAAVCNVEHSAIARACDASGGTFITRAGTEVGVASTKAFLTQVLALGALAEGMAAIRGVMSDAEAHQRVVAFGDATKSVQQLLLQEERIRALAVRIARAKSMLYLGRGALFPVALEGALKMTEIAYVHAQGFASGEMKHGPIALIERDTPVVVLVPSGELRTKTLGNIQEVKARGAFVIAVGNANDGELERLADVVLPVPDASDTLAAIHATVPLQLLAYHVADQRGLDVDQPRNLAKSVTVE